MSPPARTNDDSGPGRWMRGPRSVAARDHRLPGGPHCSPAASLGPAPRRMRPGAAGPVAVRARTCGRPAGRAGQLAGRPDQYPRGYWRPYGSSYGAGGRGATGAAGRIASYPVPEAERWGCGGCGAG